MTHEAYIKQIEKRKFSFCIWYYLRNIMWLYLSFLLIIGSVAADHHHAWETGKEYHFHVQSRTLTVLDKLSAQFTGILIKGDLTVQVISLDTLQAVVTHSLYAPVHQVLPEGWDSEITDAEYLELSLSGKPFQIKLKQGLIQDVMVEFNVPTWEVNLLKSIVSQLQIDIQGRNVITSRNARVHQPFSTFRAMEDSVGGKCEVLYNIRPLPEGDLFESPELVPLPNLHTDGHHIDITKTKNYTRCEQRMAYHSGIVGKIIWKPGSNDGLVSRSSTSRIIVSGNPEQFTIQSSVTTNEILVSSKLHDTYSGAVYSRVNLTLEKVNQIEDPYQLSSRNPTSTGNLVYMYNNPFSNLRKSRHPNVSQSRNSNEESRSDDSNPSSSSSFNSEERDYLQPEPKLDEAPENPLLPYFIGYKGMSIQKSGENYVMITARLIASITNDIKFTSVSDLDDTFADTLNPYITLVELIRTMNVKQITEIENKLYSILETDYHSKYVNEEFEKLFKQTAWDILSNAVAQAGTGPALITVKNWVKNKKLEGNQAALIISQIPKAALTPTVEYVRAFFELITDEQVRQQSCLNTTAPLAFAELIRYVQSNKSSTYYPVYSFGRLNSRQDNMFLETYIPYMATQLREAIEEGDSPRIQTYILALGNFGHPKVLSVFEPYLEGWLPLSKFQRLMMVISLNRLSENYPRIARSVAYKIYVNVYEAYELRCAAVSIIMKTNPPLNILQRMAENTNDEQDNNINCIISTNINTLADLKQPEFQDLANKARIAKQKLKPDCCTEYYSQGIFKELIVASLNVAQTSTIQTIGSDDSNIAKGMYFDIHQSIGGFNVPPSRLTYTISSIRELVDMWYQMPWMMTEDEVKKKLIIEEIVEKLDLKPEDPEQIEGNIFTDTIFNSEFYPFDNHTIERLVNKFAEYMTYVVSVKPAGNFKIGNRNYPNFYDMTLSFPTESGLPFINTLTIPKLITVSGEGSYAIKNSEVGRYVELTIAGHMLVIEKIQNRVGFVAPFEQRHYIAGIDMNNQIFIPCGLNVSSWLGSKKFEIKTYPKSYYQHGTGHMTFHLSVVPYTKRHDILSFTFPPNDTRIVNVMEPHEIEFILGNSIFVLKSDLIDETQASSKSGNEQLGVIYNVFYNSAAHYRRLDAIIFLAGAQINITENVYMMYDVNSTEATIPEIIDKQPESEERKKQLQKEVSKDIDSAISYVYDISLISDDIQQVFTIAWANSRLDNKFQTLLYWNMQLPNDGRVFMEFCTIGHIQTSPSIPLNFTKSIEETPKDEFKLEMRFGNCVNGETIKIKGNFTRSDDAKRMAMKSSLVNKCREEMKEGNFWLPTCQTANKLIRVKNHLMMSVDTNSDSFYMVANRLILMLRSLLPQENMQMFNPENDNKIVDIDIKMPPDNNNAQISVRTSMINVTFSLTNVFEQELSFSIPHSLQKLVENSEAVCVLDKTQVVTFDDKIYPLKLGNCWHVMMTTYPKRDPNNPEKTLNIPKYLRTTVMVREMDDGSKQMRMIFNDQEIHLQKSDNLLEAMVNGQVVNFTRNSYRENNFEIYQMDGMIVIFSLEYASYAVYDGERILLRPSQKYIKAIRGLCGNYDMQSDNDFIAPKNCVLSKPEEFAATYALTQEDCEGPALENKRRAEQSTCSAKSYHPSDVITDREAGRTRRNRG